MTGVEQARELLLTRGTVVAEYPNGSAELRAAVHSWMGCSAHVWREVKEAGGAR
jgi:hypothetical protein